MSDVLEIHAVGADGDGVARRPDGTFAFVPFALPGEVVDGTTIVHPSPQRVRPVCPHFGVCGGCALQHWAEAPYRAWKAGLLGDALRRAGYPDPLVRPLVVSPPGSRRRMDLAVRRVDGDVVLGLHRRRGAVLDIDACPVLHPVLEALVAPLRQLFRRLPAFRREADVVVNLLDAGPDILLRLDAAPDAAQRGLLTAFARAHAVPRISLAVGRAAPELAVQLRPALTSLSGVPVAPPPGAFLQATAEGEAAIVAAVVESLPRRRTAKSRAAELYAGCGTITFALAPHLRVAAFEGAADAVAALRQAANQAGLAGRIEATGRDLARQPLMARELAGFATVVLDPPFDGAASQVAQIAAAGVASVIYVSCNPQALARDARTLRLAGYRLAAATPIDQFPWTPRLESVVAFAR